MKRGTMRATGAGQTLSFAGLCVFFALVTAGLAWGETTYDQGTTPPTATVRQSLDQSSWSTSAITVTQGTTVYFKATTSGGGTLGTHDWDTVNGVNTDQGADTFKAQWDYNYQSSWGSLVGLNSVVSHVFNTVGTFTVRMRSDDSGTVFNDSAVLSANSITVTVNPPPPVANFTGTPTSGCAPLTVNFTDTSTNNPTSWAWDFDNNGTTDSTAQNPSHQYQTGTYTVKLTATNAGGSDSETKTSYITAAVAPVANFTGTPTSGCAPLTVNFTDTSTNSPTSWSWSFGDTGTSTQRNPSHQYTSAGTYTVTLTATNSCGSDGETKTNYITVGTAPVANFTGSPTSGCAPLTVNFTDTSTNNPTSWAWDFDGDADTDSTAQNPSHQYTSAGTYTVSLTASNGCGSDGETKTSYITVVSDAPIANFSATPTSGDGPLTVDFTDSSTNSPTSWAWDFDGDGDTDSTAQNPSYEFAIGIYDVKLTATNSCGSDVEYKEAYIVVTDPAGGGESNGSESPGPAAEWIGSESGSLCTECGTDGRPSDSVNTFTGNLTVDDIPVSYQDAYGGLPFTIAFNSRSTRTGPMGTGWTHSYNVQIEDQGGSGATLVDGNGREKWFAWIDGTGYMAPYGVYDKLERIHSGFVWTGWRLTRPNHSSLLFDTSGKLTSYADLDNLTWTPAYSGGNLSTVTDPLSRETSFTYTSGKLTQVTVPSGLHADFTYDANGRLETFTDPTGINGYTYSYNGSGNIETITDSNGREVRYFYTTYNGKTVVEHTDIYGVTGSEVYYDYYGPGEGPNPAGSGLLYTDITDTKDGQSRITREIHENTDDPGNGRYFGTLLQKIVDVGGLNLTQSWTYDAHLRTTSHQDSYQPESGGKDHIHRYYYAYDPPDPRASLVTKYIDPENYDSGQGANSPGHVYTYDSLGNKTSETTSAGRVTEYTYVSGTSRLSSTTIHDQDVNGNPVDRVTSYTYYDGTYGYQVHEMTDARGNVTHYEYDPNTGYQTVVTPQVGNATTYEYNAAGDVTSITDGNGNETTFTYDELHRQLTATYPSVGAGAKSKTTTYTCCGQDTVTDENGMVTKYEYYSGTKRLWKVTQDYGTGRLNLVTEYAYDELGNLISETNARGKTTEYTYDDGNRKVRADYPDGTYETWTYRDDGRMYTHTDGRGRTITYRYDADDRSTGSGNYVAINYPNDTDVQITRDADGLITSTVDASGTTTNVYYPSTWLKSKTVSAGTSKTVTYQYNGVGLVSRMTTPESTNFDYTYNGRNQLATVTDPSDVEVSFSYDNGGRRTRITRPGSYIDYSYNARDWVTWVHNRLTNGTTLYDTDYYYNDGALWDHTGNPLKQVETYGGADYTTTLRYDSVYRQTEETKRDSQSNVLYRVVYGYDAVGNRISETQNGQEIAFTYDDNNKLTYASATNPAQSATISYDNAGNMTSVTGNLYQTKTLVFDDDNRLSSITHGQNTDTCIYDWQGLRRRAQLNGGWHRYLYDGVRMLQNLTDDGDWRTTYTVENGSYQGMLLGLKRLDQESERFPMYDGIGSALGLADENGSVTDSYELDTFGTPSGPAEGSTPNPYRFGGAWGYITDPSGLLQLGARFYWPEVGRFVSQDPVREEVSLYGYARNNPLTSIDPEGLAAKPKPKTKPDPCNVCYEDYEIRLNDCYLDAAVEQAVAAAAGITGIATVVGAGPTAIGYGIGTGAILLKRYICKNRARRDLRNCLDRNGCN